MTKEQLKSKAEDLAVALGYKRDSLDPDVINVKDAFCIGYNEGQKSEWVEIKTMPHTGAWVLLYNGHWKGVGKYEPDERNYDEGDTEHYTDWQSETGEFISPKPTHWQLLPESPRPFKI